MEWANELRPQTIDDLVGQEANKQILKAWVEKGLPNAIILYGKSGCGKTTTSRILAKTLNAEYIELDAASNNGIEDARKINELASRLSINGNTKIFCIDEAHALSNAAWQALLKTIEQPNLKTHFIFCSTEYSKLPATIRGRSRLLKFYSLSEADLLNLAQQSLIKYGASLPEDVIDLIVTQSKGQARDLLKLLQTAVEAKVKTRDSLAKLLAIPDRKGMGSFVKAVLGRQPKTAIKVLKSIDTDLLEWTKECGEFIYTLLEDRYGIKELTGDVLISSKLKELALEFEPSLFGKFLTALLQIQKADTAYAMLYALALTGV